MRLIPLLEEVYSAFDLAQVVRSTVFHDLFLGLDIESLGVNEMLTLTCLVMSEISSPKSSAIELIYFIYLFLANLLK